MVAPSLLPLARSATAATLWAIFLYCLWNLSGFMEASHSVSSSTVASHRTSSGYDSDSNDMHLIHAYYSGSDFSVSDDELARVLHNLIHRATVLNRRDIVAAFRETDQSTLCGPREIKDVYSGKCWPFEQRCRSTPPTVEGQCYNREHLWPQSW